MRALKVTINGGAPIIAGADDLGVLSCIVTCVGALGPKAQSPRDDGTEALTLNLGGLTSRGTDAPDEHIDWLPQVPLKIGDRIAVELIETESPDPINRAELAKQREADAKKYYEHCKETYLQLRPHFEPEG